MNIFQPLLGKLRRMQIDPNVRKAPCAATHNIAHCGVSGRARKTQTHMPGHPAPSVQYRDVSSPRGVNKRPSRPQQRRPRRSQAYMASAALKQLRFICSLQLLNHAAERRLSHVQSIGSMAKMKLLGNSNKRAGLFNIHE